MAGFPEQFDSAAQKVEFLLSLFPSNQAEAGTVAGWISQVREITNETDSLLAGCLPLLPALRSEPGILRYRNALVLLRDKIESLQGQFRERQAHLLREQQHAGRVHAWAAAVSDVVESAGI